MGTLALYTTIYPDVERYLAAWYRSVLDQTDKDFRLWIGLDGLRAETVAQTIGSRIAATWVEAAEGDTPAQVRQRVFKQLVDACEAVVLVDSDDLLLPSRVATARQMLRTTELAGCRLRLVDESGDDLELTLGLPRRATPEQVFPRNNIFGLSNSAYRSDLLRRCLPIPPETELVDWFLATRAWLLGAGMAFSDRVEMSYRQHPANMVRIIPPFDSRQVARDTRRVRAHFRLIRESDLREARPHRLAELMDVAAGVESFYERIVLNPRVLERYVEALNATRMDPLWWSCVADRSLRYMWQSTEEQT